MEIKMYSPQKRQISCGIAYMWNLFLKNGTKELIYRMEIESQMEKTNSWLLGRKAGGDKLGDWDLHIHTVILKNRY